MRCSTPMKVCMNGKNSPGQMLYFNFLFVVSLKHIYNEHTNQLLISGVIRLTYYMLEVYIQSHQVTEHFFSSSDHQLCMVRLP